MIFAVANNGSSYLGSDGSVSYETFLKRHIDIFYSEDISSIELPEELEAEDTHFDLVCKEEVGIDFRDFDSRHARVEVSYLKNLLLAEAHYTIGIYDTSL